MANDKEDSQTRGQIIKDLFDRCADLSQSEREHLLAVEEVEKDISSHVLELLKYSTNEIELTQAVVNSVQVSLDIKPITAGMKIGAYELVRPLGEGGQGEVWLASRVDGNFKQKVAIKFLKPVHNQTDLLRFQSERELLASLHHPNIAQLLDGGELADNRPYMILELVEGLPVLAYCKQQQFKLKQYLTCFLQICDAISYAHSHSVIHRDIKPSNIYVTHDGTVKLLDFGIAKFINKDEVKTQTLPVMTLAYSSPEQVTGAPVSTATDIYTLGLLLYEMLTGQRAQAVISDVPADLIHEITEQLPVLPSKLIQKIKTNRSYGKKQLQGDLDNLILMAVRKEPERRYATVAAMAKDIENYLDGKPLAAVGDSWYYSTNKFLTRYPVGTALSALVLAFMVALPLVMFTNQNQLMIERDKALNAQQDAQEQSVIANRTTDFLVNILESASPLRSRGEAINLDDVLDSAERQLAVGLNEQPQIKSTLLAKLAGIQHQLGNSEKAVKHYETILRLHKDDNNLIGQAFAFGQLGIMAYFAHDEVAALGYQQQAMALTSVIEDPVALAWHQIRIATIDGFLEKNKLMTERLMQTLDLLREQGIDDPELMGRIYNELSVASEDHKKALDYNILAVDYAEELNGRMHPLFLNRQRNLAIKLKNLARYEEAEAMFIENRRNTRKLFTEEHPIYSSVVAELGALYHDKGQFTKVKEIYEEAIEISEKTSGEKSTNYVLQINNLAYLYEDMGLYDLAEPLYRKSISLRESYHAINPFRIASSRSNLARLLAKMGRYQESQNILDEVMPIYADNNKTNLYNRITALTNLIQDKPSTEVCGQAKDEMSAAMTEISGLSEKSWRRMYGELRLGELALKCRNYPAAKVMLLAAQNRAEVIYAQASEGQIRILSKTDQLLKTLPTEEIIDS